MSFRKQQKMTLNDILAPNFSLSLTTQGELITRDYKILLLTTL